MNFAYRESNKKGLNKLGVYSEGERTPSHGTKNGAFGCVYGRFWASRFLLLLPSRYLRLFGGGPKLNKDGVFKSVSIDFGRVVGHVIMFVIVSPRKVTSELPQQRLILRSADKKLDGVFK